MEQGGSPATASTRARTSPRVAAAAARRSWEDVPDNIVVRVSAFLPCRADRVHMACVHRVWHAAVTGSQRPRPPVLPPLPAQPPQLPWLIFPSTKAPTFYSPITGGYHRLCRLPPDVLRARWCGSGDGGWLVLAFDSPHAPALYNLDSGRRIPLPEVFTSQSGGAAFRLVVGFATLSASPSHGPCVVAAVALVAKRLMTTAFWRWGDASWFSTGGLLKERPQDVIYYEGAFFFVTPDEDLIVFAIVHGPNGDVTLDPVDYDMQQRKDYDEDVELMDGYGRMKRYLVESRGILLMVVRYIYDETGTQMLRVFELSVTVTNDRPPRGTWKELFRLDGRMLFMGLGCSRSFEVARYDCFQDQESQIFFLDESLGTVLSPDGGRQYSFTDMGKYSLEEMNSEPWPPGDRPTMSDKAPPTWWLHALP